MYFFRICPRPHPVPADFDPIPTPNPRELQASQMANWPSCITYQAKLAVSILDNNQDIFSNTISLKQRVECE
jgi:hypothetical protein